jgi:hypothetical protein
VTTYTAIFARFAVCTHDRPLLWAAAVFYWPSETIGGRFVVSKLCYCASAETDPAPSAVASDHSLRHAGAGGARRRAISDRISLNI